MSASVPAPSPAAQPEPLFDVIAYGEPMVELNEAEGTGGGAGRGAAGGARYLQGFGGDTSNVAIAAARQGARAAYLSAVGDDPYGRALRALWAAEGVDDRFVTTHASAPTGLYVVTHGPAGHEFSFFRKGSAASLVEPVLLPAGAAEAGRVLHLSGISLAISTSACDAGFAAMEAARAAGRLVSFDTNLRLKLWPRPRARAIILDAMGQCDICLPSFDDVATLTGLDDPDRLMDLALGCGARIVALKLGARGALVADQSGARHTIPPHPVRPVDATGAGDTFDGAFLARLLAGDDLLAAARYAATAAALSTTGYGAVAPIPRADAVRAAMASRAASATEAIA